MNLKFHILAWRSRDAALPRLLACLTGGRPHIPEGCADCPKPADSQKWRTVSGALARLHPLFSFKNQQQLLAFISAESRTVVRPRVSRIHLKEAARKRSGRSTEAPAKAHNHRTAREESECFPKLQPPLNCAPASKSRQTLARMP